MSLIQELLSNFATIAVLGAIMSYWLKTRLEESIRHEYGATLAALQAQLGLQQEVARRRMEIVSQVWAAIADFEKAAFASAGQTAAVLLSTFRESGAEGIPSELPSRSADLMRLLSVQKGVELPAEALEEVKRAVAPAQETLLASATALNDLIFANRFWLGQDLENELRRYAQDVRDAFVSLEPNDAAMRDFAVRLRALKERRQDATTILDRLWQKELKRDAA